MKVFKYLTLVIIFLFGAIFFVWNSNILLSKKSVELLNKKFLPSLVIDYNKINLEIENVSLLNRKIVLSTTDSCHKYEKHEFCFDKFILDLNVFFSFKPDYKINEIVIFDKKFEIVKSENKQKKEYISIHDEINFIRDTLESLKSINIQKYMIEIDNIIIENKINLKALLSNEKISLDFNDDKNTINLDLVSKDKKMIGELSYKNEKIKLNSELEIDLEKGLGVNGENKLYLKNSKDLSYVKFISSIDLNEENLKIDFKEMSLVGNSRVSRLKVDRCNLEIEDLMNKLDLELSCSGIYHTKKIAKINLKKSILNLKMDLIIKEKILFNEEFKLGSFKLVGENTGSNFVSINFLSGNELFFNQGKIRVNPKELDWNIKIRSFEKLVKALSGTSYSLPSPFNTLKGNLSFKSNELIKFQDKVKDIPFVAELNLDENKFNKIKISSQGVFKYNEKKFNKSQLDLEVNIERLHLYLPEIDPIKGIPPLVSNNNINQKFKKKEKTQNINYNIKIKTASSGAIRLYYFMFKPYLPLNFDLKLQNDSTKYKLEVSKKMNIEYLKRTIELSSLVLEDNKTGMIDGRFLYQRAGYDIFLDIIGTLKEPKMLLSSKPSLSQDDITSVLLFGKVSNQISSFQKESVGGTQAAISDRAFGLFSMWAFASTPIESVSYNPATKTYSAQVSLPGEVNLELGTDWEKVNSLSLKKRISDTWSVVTTYRPGDVDNLGDILLQKEFNFD
ncbi:translocation/assembly module TamB [bacterium]|nr:translocation/assembly module TamB [bacterium]